MQRLEFEVGTHRPLIHTIKRRSTDRSFGYLELQVHIAEWKDLDRKKILILIIWGGYDCSSRDDGGLGSHLREKVLPTMELLMFDTSSSLPLFCRFSPLPSSAFPPATDYLESRGMLCRKCQSDLYTIMQELNNREAHLPRHGPLQAIP